jgi:hypothetical protein
VRQCPRHGRELIEIVYADSTLRRRDFLNHLLKSIITDELALLFVKIFGHCIVFVRRHKIFQFWEWPGVFASRMRTIHCDESLHGLSESERSSLSCRLTGARRRIAAVGA